MFPDPQKQFHLPVGAYAHVHGEPNPSNNEMTFWTVGGISLGPTGNMHGIYKLLSFLTGKVKGCLVPFQFS
jgi:hypothetical protein